jgi:paraquat-inducible protein B
VLSRQLGAQLHFASAKMIKCKIYEDRLAGHAQIFADDKREVQFSLQLESKRQLDKIDKKIDQHQADLKKQMQELFRVLETEDERKVRESIKNEAQDYIGNKELQQQLFAKGEKFLTPSQLANEKKSLEKELAENVDEVFKKHIAVFTSQLEKENGRLFQTMTADKKEILAAVDSGPHMTINDLVGSPLPPVFS